MPLPWEGKYLVRNLRTLSNLKGGRYLSVLKKGENIGTVRGDKVRGLRAEFKRIRPYRQKRRKGKGENLLNDDHYLRPLLAVFRAAVSRYMDGDSKVTEGLLMGAFQGLQKLRVTYPNAPEATKVAEIIRKVGSCLPLGIMNQAIYLRSGEHRFILANHFSPHARNVIHNVFFGQGSQHLVADEYQASKNEVQQIFENDKPSTTATIVPCTKQAYRRTSSGVCKGYWSECVNRYGVDINGDKATRVAGLRRLYLYLGKDEGLLFAVSQVASATVMMSLVSMLFDSHLGCMPFQTANGRMIRIHGWNPKINIVNQDGTVTVSIDSTVNGDQQAFAGDILRDVFADNPKYGRTLRSHGILSVRLIFSVKLKKDSNRVGLAISRGELLVTTS